VGGERGVRKRGKEGERERDREEKEREREINKLILIDR
jgi:hypothetical protein